ncbi:MAG: 2-oxoacid:ferredoxin oxidoreductase subunit gamma [Desulfobacteraceae bacterium]|nr:MAG: 2-oxoacid:ferredoxin oxidoreductase subunit gamma [Desulfobacteraceae bacterium]
MIDEMRGTAGIRLAGFGGQGVILAGMLLGHAAVHDGLFAAGSNSYGAQARGSACKAEVVISSEPIDYPHVELAALFVAMSQGGYDAFEARVAPGGEIFFDKGLVAGLRGNHKEKGFDVTSISMSELKSNQAANVIWVGVVAGATGWFSEEALHKAIRAIVPDRFIDLNLKALDLGLSIGRKEG